MANITEQCAACPNTQFKVLTKVGTIRMNTGLWRCECTVCGNIQTVQSKLQMFTGVEDADDYTDRRIIEEKRKQSDRNQYD